METAKTAVDLFAAMAETPLALVNQILVSGEFRGLDEPVAENESIIGEMTSFERALHSAADMIASDNNNWVRERASQGEEIDSFVVQKNKENYEIFGKLMWASIKNRLGRVAFENDSLGVREGYKIVKISSSISTSIRPELEQLLGALFGAGHASEDEHDCENCPDYALCDLLNKKVR